MLIRRVWPSRPTFDSSLADFEQLRRDMLRLLDGGTSETSGETGAGVFPPINVTQDDNSFYVRAETPGINANELAISALRNRLSIAGKREIPPEQESASYHRKERAEGSFSRIVALPAEVNSEGVEASYADGVLSVKMPKAEQAKPRQISVKT